MQKIIFGCGLILIAASCDNNVKSASETAKDSSKVKGDVLVVNMDSTVSPSKDFFMYANGGWIKRNPIPGNRGSWTIGHLVIEENQKRIRSIAEKAASSGGAQGSSEQKIGDFYSTAMDSAKIEQQGLQPLQPYLQKIDAITDVKSLIATVAELKKIGSHTLFSDYVTQDDKNSEVMSYKLAQGGIGLPEREYYFKKDSATVAITSAYVECITKILELSGEDSIKAAKSAQDIFGLETKLAQASRKIEDLRDPYKNYNKMAIGDLPKMASNIDWTNYLQSSQVKSIDSVIVGQPEFFSALNNLLQSTPIDVWKSQLKYNLIADFSEALPEKYALTVFNFTKQLSGAKERLPRWQRVIDNQENVMGELLGQLYVKEFFNETAKKRYADMVEAIREALRARIGQLDWMTDSTKQKAYAKLSSMKKRLAILINGKIFLRCRLAKKAMCRTVSMLTTGGTITGLISLASRLTVMNGR